MSANPLQKGEKSMSEIQAVTTPFYSVADVQNILGVGKSKAYQIIKKLNDELSGNGFITVSGKVSKKYFNERIAL